MGSKVLERPFRDFPSRAREGGAISKSHFWERQGYPLRQGYILDANPWLGFRVCLPRHKPCIVPANDTSGRGQYSFAKLRGADVSTRRPEASAAAGTLRNLSLPRRGWTDRKTRIEREMSHIHSMK